MLGDQATLFYHLRTVISRVRDDLKLLCRNESDETYCVNFGENKAKVNQWFLSNIHNNKSLIMIL